MHRWPWRHHPAKHLEGFTGILQADAYSGLNALYDPARKPGPVTPALCWAHSRRQFFELADIAKNAKRGRSAAAVSPIALEPVRRIDALFEIERDINSLGPDQRLAVRQEQSAPLLLELETWLRGKRAELSRSAAVANGSRQRTVSKPSSPETERTRLRRRGSPAAPHIYAPKPPAPSPIDRPFGPSRPQCSPFSVSSAKRLLFKNSSPLWARRVMARR